MKWYYLIRDEKILDCLKAESLAQASYRFRHNSTDNKAKIGDHIMVSVAEAVQQGDWEWKE